MTSFTPGPWTMHPLKKSWGIYDMTGTRIADVTGAYGVAHDRRCSDARLIAAAPELYGALKAALADASHEMRADTYQLVCAALAKVEQPKE